MPLHDGLFHYFDKAENAFISAYRRYTNEQHTDLEIVVEYMASPDLNGKTLILPDPMLATGGSMELTYQALLKNGKPRKLFLAAVIASQEAVDYLQKTMPELDVFSRSRSYSLPLFGYRQMADQAPAYASV